MSQDVPGHSSWLGLQPYLGVNHSGQRFNHHLDRPLLKKRPDLIVGRLLEQQRGLGQELFEFGLCFRRKRGFHGDQAQGLQKGEVFEEGEPCL